MMHAIAKARRIAFQGEPGAYANLAAREAVEHAAAIPKPSFEDAIEAVRSSDCDLCIIPVENSLMGRIAWFCEWLLFRFSRRLIVSNGEVAARARAMNPRLRVLQTQNGYDSALLTLAPGEAAPPFLLYLGRFDIYMKGLDRLVSAFASLPTEVRGSLRLVLAGAADPVVVGGRVIVPPAPPGAAVLLAVPV